MNLREIDRLVAEKVMGWEPVYDDGDIISFITEYGTLLFFSDDDECEWNPSTDIRDAWQVVEKMKRSNFSARHRFVTELQKEVTPKELKDKNQLLDLGWMIFYLTPKSICLAALKAAGVNIE